MSLTVTGVLAGLLVLVLTFELLRRRALREKYAALWLLVAVVALVFALFPSVLDRLAGVLGFQVPANLLFALAALVLLAVSMQLSLELGRVEDQSQRLAEEVALLRLDLEQLRDDTPSSDPSPSDG
jgi:hypothetical protein